MSLTLVLTLSVMGTAKEVKTCGRHVLYMRLCICLYRCVYTCLHICQRPCLYTCAYAWMSIHMSVYISARVCAHVCTCVHMSIHIYVHVHIHVCLHQCSCAHMSIWSEDACTHFYKVFTILGGVLVFHDVLSPLNCVGILVCPHLTLCWHPGMPFLTLCWHPGMLLVSSPVCS